MNNLISNQSGVIFANCNFNYKPYSLLAFAFLLFAFNSFAQNRLVLNNDVYAVIKNNAFIVINNSSTNAITTMGSGGNIISEGEFNTVKWCIGTATGSYTVPFAKSYGNKMPLIVNITKPGGGSGSILFSTFGGDWNNELYHPSSVTNMVNSVGDNNSNKVIDRFWIIEANGYTSKPSASITFSYLEAEWSATGNSISEANLQAQSFNSSIAPNGTWWNSIPQGTASTVPNSVTNVAVNIANFFRTWTLVDGNFPLPIELLSFTATCNTASQSFNNSVTLKWTTSSETNNDFFVLEKSIDAINFDSIATIKGSGNSHDSTVSLPFLGRNKSRHIFNFI